MSEIAEVTPLEAERILGILEDTAEKLAFLDSITPDVLQHRYDYHSYY